MTVEPVVTVEVHPLHSPDRLWLEKNCYLDLWIQLLAMRSLEPLAASAFIVAADFEVDQWTFFKYPPADLQELYGIDVSELNIWRPVLTHITDHTGADRLLTVEVDAFYLPDTAGISYRTSHTKTTIVPLSIDVARQHLRYLHNAGSYELSGADFGGLFAEAGLPPYVELIKLTGMHLLSNVELAQRADALLVRYLKLRPVGAASRLVEQINRDLPALAAGTLDFNAYAFATCRQFGAGAEIGALFLRWLAAQDRPDPTSLLTAADHLEQAAASAKSVQFSLARLAAGRRSSPTDRLDEMAQSWERGIAAVAGRDLTR